MRTFGITLASLGLIGAAAALIPGLYLHLRAAGDPEGLVDGLLRLGWTMPMLWVFGMWLEADRRLSRLRGLISVQTPILLLLAAVAVFALGIRNDGKVIVSEAGEASAVERHRKEHGEAAWVEGDLGPVAPLARWSHLHLPGHPIP